MVSRARIVQTLGAVGPLLTSVGTLVKEAVAESMTNSAPLLGAETGGEYITASRNCLDLACCHSVVLLFGMTVGLAESTTFGPRTIGQMPFWIFVYLLMVHCTDDGVGAVHAASAGGACTARTPAGIALRTLIRDPYRDNGAREQHPMSPVRASR